MQESFPKLIPDARIDVFVEGRKKGSDSDDPGLSLHWVPSQLLAIVDVSSSSAALMTLIGAQGGPYEPSSWELSWSLASMSNDPLATGSGSYREVENALHSPNESYRKLPLHKSINSSTMAKAATRIAVLGVSSESYLKDAPNLGISQPQKRGDFLLVMGSPFGVLSPLHFYNSISVGTVANCFPADSQHSSLLMADIHVLPGMEGSPVFDKRGFLIGILTRPLRQKGGTAEIQLVISWGAIVSAGGTELQKEAERAQSELIDGNINSIHKTLLYRSKEFRRLVKDPPRCPDLCLSRSSLDKVTSSIVLVTVGDGSWASGIVLNNHGLILTNAHILEPWRFGRASHLSLINKNSASSFENERYMLRREESADKEERRILLPLQWGSSKRSVTNGNEASYFNSDYRRYPRISVRLHHTEKRIWYGATVVYVSKGPWDVALLQIESVPDELCPITPEYAYPAIGSTIHVIGHGLLGPHSDTSPSVSTGVVANVVRMPGPSMVGTGIGEPVMIQTTAAVHPGASGGAVVNLYGRLVGLVTSNARHGGGTIIPHLNFSIPCAALQPIFEFSDKQDLSKLQGLDHPNEALSSVWALIPPTSTMLQTSEKNDGEAKGSRFSLFLAEQQKGQKHLTTPKFPSKI